MKNNKPLRISLSFLTDNFLIYLFSDILATFLNPYDNSAQNRMSFTIIYVVTLITYITFSEAKYKTTLGKKIFKIK